MRKSVTKQSSKAAKKRRITRLVRIALLFFVLSAIGITVNYFWISGSTKDRITQNIHEVSETPVALVLGTSSQMSDGRTNLFFKYRLQAVAKLYKARKIKKILLSGDNSKIYYNEPADMKKTLVKMGVLGKDIVLDYAGFRTFDSVVRAKKVFGQKKILIVSQEFQLHRAIFIADNFDIQAEGFVAKTPSYFYSSKTFAREILARVKCTLDCYFLNTKPKFLGKKEIIDLND